jgi:hypothetical protein
MRSELNSQLERIRKHINNGPTMASCICDALFQTVLHQWARDWISELDGVTPSLLVSHYYGIQFLTKKTTVVYVPDIPKKGALSGSFPRLAERHGELAASALDGCISPASVEALHRTLLACYERLQNHSHYTLNAVMAHRCQSANKQQLQVMTCSWDNANVGLVTEKKSSFPIFHLNLNETITKFILRKETIYGLLNEFVSESNTANLQNVVGKLGKETQNLRDKLGVFISKKDMSAADSKIFSEETLNAAQRIDSVLEEAIGNLLVQGTVSSRLAHLRDHAVASLLAETNECPGLKELCEQVWEKLIEGGIPAPLGGATVSERQQLDAAIRLLQGVSAYSEYGNSVVTISIPVGREKGRFVTNVSWCAKLAPDKLKKIAKNVGTSMKELVSELPAEFCHKPNMVSNSKDKELGFVLTDFEVSEAVKKALEGTLINVSHLAATLRLAEVFRPEAVHEQSPINLTLCLGTPHHFDRFFLADYSNIPAVPGEGSEQQGMALAEPTMEQSFLAWLPVDPSEAKMLLPREMTPERTRELIVDNLNVCKARIKGNHGNLAGRNSVLFIDMLQPFPCITHVGKLAPEPYTNRDLSIRDASKQDRNMCFIRVSGRSRVELIHDGKTVASWVDARASWVVPPQWDSASLSRYLQCVFTSEYREYFDFIAECAIRIADTGHGATFVFTDAPMENEDKKIGLNNFLGQMSSQLGVDSETWLLSMLGKHQVLIDAVTQDGGTVFQLTKRNDSHDVQITQRQQFLPWRKESPFQIWKCGLKEMWCKRGSPLYWREWYDVLHWGTRHLSTLGMAACLCGQTIPAKDPKKSDKQKPDVVGICISADGPIHVFDRGVAVNPKHKDRNMIAVEGDPEHKSPEELEGAVKQWRNGTQNLQESKT